MASISPLKRIATICNASIARGRADKLRSSGSGCADSLGGALCGRAAPRCAPLPTYPFMRKRYWVGGASKAIARPRYSARTTMQTG